MTDTFIEDFWAVIVHFNLTPEERQFCWQASKRSPKRARICYRVIARSL